MNQTTNTAATTLEQVNAMPAATWGWLKMNQTKLELSDELAAAPTEAVKVEGLDEQFRGAADAFNAAMDAMALPELDYFLAEFLPAFPLTLDELQADAQA